MVEAHPGINISGNDRCVLRDLAKRYRDLCQSEENSRRVCFWRSFNSLEKCRPAVFVDLNYATHMDEQIDEALPAPRVEEPILRIVENWFQRRLWQAQIPDDRVFSPWFPVRAVMEHSKAGEWGVALDCIHDADGGSGWRCNAVIKHPEDLKRLKRTPHKVIDPDPPLARVLRDVFEEILPVHVDRSSIYSSWGGYDLSTAAGTLLGLEEMLLAFYEAPEMVHELMAFMRDSVIANFLQCESEGDWSTAESNNYAVPSYNRELPDPECNSHGAAMKDLQLFMHGQEFETVSPSQQEEFLLEYQMPIMEYDRLSL